MALSTAEYLATVRPVGSLDVVAYFDGPTFTGVSVSQTGCIFVNFPK